jgi:tetratricopeptide (TPR) repeat protein
MDMTGGGMQINTVNLRQALKHLVTIFDADSRKYRKNFNLALSYESAGDQPRAIRHYQECISLHPNRDLYQNIGMLYFEMQDYVNAAHFLEKTVREHEAALFLGLSYLKLNAPLKAEETLQGMGQVKSTHTRMLAGALYEFKNGTGRWEGSTARERHSRDGADGELKRLCEVLELDGVSSKKEIKKAYLKMAKLWHPDRFHHDPRLLTKAEQKMKVINEAYYQLCNG